MKASDILMHPPTCRLESPKEPKVCHLVPGRRRTGNKFVTNVTSVTGKLTSSKIKSK